MNPKDVKYLYNGNPLEFDLITGFAINPIDGSNAFFAADWRNILLTAVNSDGAATHRVFAYGSEQILPPDFNAASTISNSYAPIVLADLSIQNTYYNGSLTLAVSGTKLVEFNTNMCTWIAIKRDSTRVDAKLTVTNNA